MMVDPKFFQTKQPDQLDLESFMNTATQAANLKERARDANMQSQQESSIPVSPVNQQADLAMLKARLMGGGMIGNNANDTMQRVSQARSSGLGQPSQNQLFQEQAQQYSINKDNAFNNALADGDYNKAASIDALKYADFLNKQMSLQSTQSNMQLNAAKGYMDLAKGQKDLQETPYMQETQKKDAEYMSTLDTKADKDAQDVGATQDILPVLRDTNTGFLMSHGGSDLTKVLAESPLISHYFKDPATKQAIIEAYTNKMAGELTKENFNRTTNTEFEAMKKVAPNVGATPEANLVMAYNILTMKQRGVAQRQFIKDFVSQSGGYNPDTMNKARAAWNSFITQQHMLKDSTDPMKGVDPDANNYQGFLSDTIKNGGNPVEIGKIDIPPAFKNTQEKKQWLAHLTNQQRSYVQRKLQTGAQ